MTGKPWLVQKFGGTSLGKCPLDIANNIVKVYSQQHRIAVICSARSTKSKSEGTTTKLLDLAKNALSDKPFIKCIENIRSSHIADAKQNIKSLALVEKLISNINKECYGLINIISAAKVIKELSPRTFDSIISVGEKLACLYMAAIIEDTGLSAVYLDFSHILSKMINVYDKKLDQSFYEYLTQEIKTILNSIDNDSIPVITGFFGPVPGGLIKNIRRGYTDLCASLVAVAVKAEELQIWKEVDGIFTADPRKVPNARLIPVITPEEASELTYYGSEVIHPFTMEQVIKVGIPIRIKNVNNSTGNGTVIFPRNPENFLFTSRQRFIEFSNRYFENVNVGGPIAVTVKNNISIINIHSNRKNVSHGFLAHIFALLHKWKLVVDLISTSEVHVSMALQQSTVESVPFDSALSDLKNYGTVDVVAQKLCIVSLVGTQMKESIGTAGNMFQALADASINIEMISQGASEINISVVIAEKDGVKALNALHQKLLDITEIPSTLNLRNLTIGSEKQHI